MKKNVLLVLGQYVKVIMRAYVLLVVAGAIILIASGVNKISSDVWRMLAVLFGGIGCLLALHIVFLIDWIEDLQKQLGEYKATLNMLEIPNDRSRKNIL